jgi:hypothetical protein
MRAKCREAVKPPRKSKRHEAMTEPGRMLGLRARLTEKRLVG